VLVKKIDRRNKEIQSGITLMTCMMFMVCMMLTICMVCMLWVISLNLFSFRELGDDLAEEFLGDGHIILLEVVGDSPDDDRLVYHLSDL
jgi:hypothetical protein